MQKDLADMPGKEMVMLSVEYPPGAVEHIHRHDAYAFVYVLDGSIVEGVRGWASPWASKRPSALVGRTFAAPARCWKAGLGRTLRPAIATAPQGFFFIRDSTSPSIAANLSCAFAADWDKLSPAAPIAQPPDLALPKLDFVRIRRPSVSAC
jgi:hypothetical protein